MRASGRARWWLAFAAGAYVLLHVATLTRSPIPYYDDTYMASISETFARTGELRLAACPLIPGNVGYLYGPVYFWAQRAVFAAFGFGNFQNRLLGLVFGIALVPLVFASLRLAGVRATVALGAAAVFALDPTLILSWHSGRMDDVAVFFLLASFVLVQTTWRRDDEPRLGRCVAAGLLAAAGVLTTPRPGYLVAVLGLVLLLRWLRAPTRARAMQLVCWGTPFAACVLAWAVYAFGGPFEMLAYYREFTGMYVGGRFSVRKIHVPMLALLAVLAGMRLRVGVRIGFDELLWFAFLGIAAFYALGINPPQFGTIYSISTIPLVYLAMARLVDALPRARVAPAVLALGLAFNGSAFAARTLIELGEWRSRDPRHAEDVVRALVPAGARVVGDDRYYFAVRRAGAEFQYLRRGGTVEERVAYHADTFRFDYLIADEQADAELVRAYARRAPLTKIGEVPAAERGALVAWVSRLGGAVGLGAPLVADYRATVFARAPALAGASSFR